MGGWQTTELSPSSRPRVILWIRCECCKGTVWVPFKMLRERIPMLSAMTLDQLGARMRCDKCGKRPRAIRSCKSERHARVRSKLSIGVENDKAVPIRRLYRTNGGRVRLKAK